MGLTMTVAVEKRQAVLRIPARRADGGTEVHKECVFVYQTLSCDEWALCEHPDGTVTREHWEHVKFLCSRERFEEVCWDGPEDGS